jgi:hypothetical protein
VPPVFPTRIVGVTFTASAAAWRSKAAALFEVAAVPRPASSFETSRPGMLPAAELIRSLSSQPLFSIPWLRCSGRHST